MLYNVKNCHRYNFCGSVKQRCLNSGIEDVFGEEDMYDDSDVQKKSSRLKLPHEDDDDESRPINTDMTPAQFRYNFIPDEQIRYIPFLQITNDSHCNINVD